MPTMRAVQVARPGGPLALVKGLNPERRHLPGFRFTTVVSFRPYWRTSTTHVAES
jgi:hypothetical protein